MPTYRHGDTGFGAVNAAMGANFARNGGILGMFGKDKQKEAQERAIAAEMALQKLRGDQGLALERERGGQGRLTLEQGHALGLTAEQVRSVNSMKETNNKGDQERKTIRTSANAGTMAKNNLLDTDENQGAFTGATADPIIGNVRGDAMSAGRDREFIDRVKASPEGQDAMTSNFLSKNYADTFANVAKGTVGAGPGQTVVSPVRGDMSPPTQPSQFNMLQGATTDTSVTPGTPNPAFPMMPVPDKITSQQTPGRMVPRIPVRSAPSGGTQTGTNGVMGMPPQEAPFSPPQGSLMDLLKQGSMAGVGGAMPMPTAPAAGGAKPQSPEQMMALIQLLAQMKQNPALAGKPY